MSSTCPLHILYISSTYPLHILYSVCCSICRLWRILGTLYSSTASTGQFSWLADEQASSSKSPTIGVYTSLHVLYMSSTYPLHILYSVCCSICRLWRILGTLYSSTASTGQFSWLANEQASSSKSPTIGVYTSLHVLYMSSTYPLHILYSVCCSICRLWRILGTLYSSTASTGQFSWLANEQASSSKSPTIGVYTSLHVLYMSSTYPLHILYISSTYPLQRVLQYMPPMAHFRHPLQLYSLYRPVQLAG